MSTEKQYDPDALNALSRAGRLIAAMRAKDDAGARNALHEANRENKLLLLAIAAAGLAGGLADQLHGDRAQLVLDGMALDAGWFRDREIARLMDTGDDDE